MTYGIFELTEDGSLKLLDTFKGTKKNAEKHSKLWECDDYYLVILRLY